MMLDGTCTMPQVTKLWDGGWDLRMLVGYIRDLLKRPDTRLLPENIREKYGNLPSLPLGYENDYGVEDDAMEKGARRLSNLPLRRKSKELVSDDRNSNLVNLYALEKPVFPVKKSSPDDDLREGGTNTSIKSSAAFCDRAFNLYLERPAKFKAVATEFCRRECKRVGESLMENNVAHFA